jgi:hypothetical protein
VGNKPTSSGLATLKPGADPVSHTRSSRPRAKSETVSFRVPSDLRLILESEARKTGVALNTLVTQIFARYASWGQFAGRLKLLPVNKDLLREVFQSMPKEKIIEVGKRLGETTGREEILFLFQQVNPQTFVEYMDVWTSHFDACKHKYDGKTHFYTVHHDVNLNFSIFTKEYLASMIQSTIPRTVNFERVTPNALTFSFELP